MRSLILVLAAMAWLGQCKPDIKVPDIKKPDIIPDIIPDK
jgi:hypothetical protein